MKTRLWHLAFVGSCLLFAISPCSAQFGGGIGDMGGMIERGIPTTIDLKDATLGQVLDTLEPSSIKSEENQTPLNILASDKLRELKVGTLKLTDMYPKAALQAISKLTEDSFIIEEVAGGQVLILRPAQSIVVVKAIRLPWMDRSVAIVTNSGAQAPTVDEQAEALKNIERRTLELKRAIEMAFQVHEQVSGRTLPAPKLETQESLSMMIVIGAPESVTIASEIINATNPEYVPPPVMPGGGGMMGAGASGGGGGGGGFFSIPSDESR